MYVRESLSQFISLQLPHDDREALLALTLISVESNVSPTSYYGDAIMIRKSREIRADNQFEFGTAAVSRRRDDSVDCQADPTNLQWGCVCSQCIHLGVMFGSPYRSPPAPRFPNPNRIQ